MKNKTLLGLFFFLAFGDIYLKMPQSNIFCTDFGNSFTVGEISTILTGWRDFLLSWFMADFKCLQGKLLHSTDICKQGY